MKGHIHGGIYTRRDTRMNINPEEYTQRGHIYGGEFT